MSDNIEASGRPELMDIDEYCATLPPRENAYFQEFLAIVASSAKPDMLALMRFAQYIGYDALISAYLSPMRLRAPTNASKEARAFVKLYRKLRKGYRRKTKKHPWPEDQEPRYRKVAVRQEEKVVQEAADPSDEELYPRINNSEERGPLDQAQGENGLFVLTRANLDHILAPLLAKINSLEKEVAYNKRRIAALEKQSDPDEPPRKKRKTLKVKHAVDIKRQDSHIATTQ